MNRFHLLKKLGFKRVDSGRYVRDCIEVNTKTNRIKYGLMNLPTDAKHVDVIDDSSWFDLSDKDERESLVLSFDEECQKAREWFKKHKLCLQVYAYKDEFDGDEISYYISWPGRPNDFLTYKSSLVNFSLVYVIKVIDQRNFKNFVPYNNYSKRSGCVYTEVEVEQKASWRCTIAGVEVDPTSIDDEYLDGEMKFTLVGFSGKPLAELD